MSGTITKYGDSVFLFATPHDLHNLGPVGKLLAVLAVPNIEFMFRSTPLKPHLWFPILRPAYTDAYGIRPTLLHPDSRGEVLLGSTDPRDPIRIIYNFFSAPNDLLTLREGFKRARETGNQKPLDRYRGLELMPGSAVRSEEQIDAFIRKTALTVHHPVGTCAMGTGTSVVDPHLRVRGIERLRVVDASAMPDLVSAHINAGVLMMAEKASDLIRGRSQPACTENLNPDIVVMKTTKDRV